MIGVIRQFLMLSKVDRRYRPVIRHIESCLYLSEVSWERLDSRGRWWFNTRRNLHELSGIRFPFKILKGV